MPTRTLIAPPLPNAPLARFSAGRYEELTRVGFFGPNDKIELIDGYLVERCLKTTRTPRSWTC